MATGADVNLTVGVTSVGVQQAINDLNALKKAGLDTGIALTKLQQASSKSLGVAMDARALGNTKVYNQGIKQAATATAALNKELGQQERLYKRLSKLDVQSTATQRLTQLGRGGGLTSGLAIANQMRDRNNAASANPVKDLIAYEKQLQQVEAARNQQAAANANLQNARFEKSIASLTQQEQATRRLTVAEREMAAAQKAYNVANGSLRGNTNNPAALAAQAKATNDLATATNNLSRAQQNVNQHREASAGDSFRYLILAGLATGVATAIYHIGEEAITASAKIERSFADVERTFDGSASQLARLQGTLTALSTETPISVIDLSQIATLGNQLGVAKEDIESFTTTIAQYTAVSGQSAEDASTAFGRISNLTGLAASQYSNLASAITYVARTTVATESTIQNTAKEISALSAGAGFSADAIVGLAGALSSLAIPPERARGALSLYFGALNGAVAEGGPKLQAFADLTGKTTDQISRLVRENKGQEVFTAFISGLSELDTVAKTTALDTLGLSTIRVDQTMRALAQNVPLVTSAFAGANQAFNENTEIANQYAIIQDTLMSQWAEFQNAILNAAGALGDSFAPAAKGALEIITDLLVQVQAFSKSPFGATLVRALGLAAALVAGIAALIGVLAIAKAGMVVFSFALAGIGWTTQSAGLRGYVASMFLADKATRAAALSSTSFSVALAEQRAMMSASTIGAKALAGSMMLLKIALPILAITAAIAVLDGLFSTITKIADPSVKLAGDLTGLKDALLTDRRASIGDDVDTLGKASASANPAVSEFNAAILAAIEVQRQASGALDETNKSLGAQDFALGETSKAWLNDALKAQEDIADIVGGKDFWESLTESGGGGDATISQDEFFDLITGGLELDKISEIAITQGKDAAIAAYDGWRDGFAKQNPDLANAADRFKEFVLPSVLGSVTAAYKKAAVEAALAGNEIEGSGAVAVGTAADFDKLGNYIGSAVENGEALVVTFSGVTNRIEDFRSAIQGAIEGSVGFDNVLKKAEAAAQAVADLASEESGEDVLPLGIDAASFGAALDASINEATNFYNGISALAAGGNQSFALQLAELGPEAQGILTSALALDDAGKAKLEASAKYAAFLASDAFKNEINAQMTDQNQAYALILKGGGSLGDVQSYIAAQVSGVGAEWERQWLLQHPNLPLSVTPELTGLSDEAINVMKMQAEGKLVLKARVEPTFNPATLKFEGGGQTWQDTTTGASITLPAQLSGTALTDSLAVWAGDQNAQPETIEAEINKPGLSASLDEWVASQGTISIYARIVPTNGDSLLPGLKGVGGKVGGLPENFPRFANGGMPGVYRGPGSGTSDSFLAAVSNGEYHNTAKSTKFWGVDFFDSLNKQMLPASIVSMLKGAASAGGGGPQSVTNVAVTQVNPVTRDPLKQYREDAEMISGGLWK